MCGPRLRVGASVRSRLTVRSFRRRRAQRRRGPRRAAVEARGRRPLILRRAAAAELRRRRPAKLRRAATPKLRRAELRRRPAVLLWRRHHHGRRPHGGRPARAGREPGPIILRRAALAPARRRLGRALHGPRRRRSAGAAELSGDVRRRPDHRRFPSAGTDRLSWRNDTAAKNGSPRSARAPSAGALSGGSARPRSTAARRAPPCTPPS